MEMPLKSKKSRFLAILLGILSVCILSSLGCLAYLCINARGLPLSEVWFRVFKYKLFAEMVTIGSVPSVLLFFGAIRLRKDHFAKGVLLAYLCIAMLVFTLKFMIE